MSKPNLIGNTEEKILRQMVRKEVERQMNEYIVGQRIKSMYQDGKMVTEERKFFLFKEIIDEVNFPRGEIERMTVHQTTVKETPSFDRFRGVFTGEELTVHYFFFNICYLQI